MSHFSHLLPRLALLLALLLAGRANTGVANGAAPSPDAAVAASPGAGASRRSAALPPGPAAARARLPVRPARVASPPGHAAPAGAQACEWRPFI